MSLGVVQAHPNGVAGMAIMSGSSSNSGASIGPAVAAVAEHLSHDEGVAPPYDEADGPSHDLEAGGGGVQEVGGMLVTCGKTEGTVKIWDYTSVGEDGSWGRCGFFTGHLSNIGTWYARWGYCAFSVKQKNRTRWAPHMRCPTEV